MSLVLNKFSQKLGIALRRAQGDRNTKGNGFTPEAQLELRVKFCQGDELTEGIID